MTFWEYEITDLDFSILMSYIKGKQEEGEKVYLNDFDAKEGDEKINSMADFQTAKPHMIEWLKVNRPDVWKEKEKNFPNGLEWKRMGGIN